MAEENAQLRLIKSLYMHVPFCRHLCNYCDFYKTIPGPQNDYQNYEDLLSQSFAVQENLFAEEGYSWEPLETLYLGGGTPSLWGARGADFLAGLFRSKKLQLAKDIEFTLEVNPGSWNDEGIEAWEALGVNRFSLGVQSLDSYFLKVLDRVHNLQDVHDTLAKFNQMQANFSVDFMLGLPFSKSGGRDIIRELEQILAYAPSHISLYILTTKKNYIHAAELPDDSWVESEYLAVSEFLQKRGFNHYEVSNFSLPGKESRHNMRYWDSESVAAVGPSATGFLSHSGLRYKWKSRTSQFEREQLDEKQLKLERLYMGLRAHRGIDPDEFFPSNKIWKLVQSWQELGYLKGQKPRLILSSKGYLMLDSLLDDLFKEDLV